MHISKKRFVIIIVILAFIFTNLGVFAEPTVQEIKAQVASDINMLLNGKDFNPIESDGSALSPITYKGRTYLPVRALCDAIGVAVDYDTKNKTIIIGERKEYVNVDMSMYTDIDCTAFTKDATLLTTPTATYKWGIINDPSLNHYSNSFSVKVSKKYSKFIASLYLSEKSKKAQTVSIRNNDKNGELLKLIDLKPGETTEISIDVAGIDLMYVTARDPSDMIIVGEPKFK